MFRIVIKDFQIIESAKLDIDGLTFLVGSNNNGKSSVIRALHFGMYNQSGDDFVRDGADFSQVAVKFSEDNFAFAWRKRRGKGGEYLIGDGAYSKFGKSYFDEVVNKGLQPLNTSVGEFFLHFWRQKEPFLVVSRPDTHKFEILSSIFNGENYQEVLRKVGADALEIKREQDKLYMEKDLTEKSVKELQKQVQVYENILSNEDNVEKIGSIVNKMESIEELREKYEEAVAKREGLSDRAKLYNKVHNYLRKEADELSNTLTDLENAYNNLHISTAYEFSKQRKEKYSSVAKLCRSAVDTFESIDIGEVLQKMEALCQISENHSSLISSREGWQSKAEEAKRQLTDARKALAEFKVCPTCGKKLKGDKCDGD